MRFPPKSFQKFLCPIAVALLIAPLCQSAFAQPITIDFSFTGETTRESDKGFLEGTPADGDKPEIPGQPISFSISLSRLLIAGEQLRVPFSINRASLDVATDLGDLALKKGATNTGISLETSATTVVVFSGKGAQIADLEMPITPDNKLDTGESAVFALGTPVINTPTAVSLVSRDDDERTAHVLDDEYTICFGDSAYWIDEDEGPLTMNLNMSPLLTRDVTIHFQYVNENAIMGEDYLTPNTTEEPVTIPAGQKSYTHEVPIIADQQIEANELFYVTVVQDRLPDGQPFCRVSVIIRNDDAVVNVSPVDTGVDERNIISSVPDDNNTFATVSTASTVDIRVSLELSNEATFDQINNIVRLAIGLEFSGSITRADMENWTLAADPPANANRGITLMSDALRLPQLKFTSTGSRVAILTASVKDDFELERDETLFYTEITGASGVLNPGATRDSRIVTIRDDEYTVCAAASNGIELREEVRSTSNSVELREEVKSTSIPFLIHRGKHSASDRLKYGIRVQFSYADGTATNPSDYVPIINTFVPIPRGITEYRLPIRMVDDNVVEETETFRITTIPGYSSDTAVQCFADVSILDGDPNIRVRPKVFLEGPLR